MSQSLEKYNFRSTKLTRWPFHGLHLVKTSKTKFQFGWRLMDGQAEGDWHNVTNASLQELSLVCVRLSFLEKFHIFLSIFLELFKEND